MTQDEEIATVVRLILASRNVARLQPASNASSIHEAKRWDEFYAAVNACENLTMLLAGEVKS